MITDKKILTYRQMAYKAKKLHNQGYTLAFTSGCYDILHLGHIIYINFCKSKGEVLIVSLGDNQTVRNLKGPTRPINNQHFRTRMVSALAIVDFVVISEEVGKMDHDRLVLLIKPDEYVVPETDSMLTQKRYLIENVGGRMITCRHLPPNHYKGGISTTNIEKKLRLD